MTDFVFDGISIFARLLIVIVKDTSCIEKEHTDRYIMEDVKAFEEATKGEAMEVEASSGSLADHTFVFPGDCILRIEGKQNIIIGNGVQQRGDELVATKAGYLRCTGKKTKKYVIDNNQV